MAGAKGHHLQYEGKVRVAAAFVDFIDMFLQMVCTFHASTQRCQVRLAVKFPVRAQPNPPAVPGTDSDTVSRF